MAIAKSQMVRGGVEPPIKAALQLAAERKSRSLANMFEVMVVAYCRPQGYPLEGAPDETITWHEDRAKGVESSSWFKVLKSERINDHNLVLADKQASLATLDRS